MRILSQDRKNLIIDNNVIYMAKADDNGKEVFVMCIDMVNGVTYRLGEYETELECLDTIYEIGRTNKKIYEVL